MRFCYHFLKGCGVCLIWKPKKTWMSWMRTGIFTYMDPGKINWMYVDSISVICESFPLRHQHRPTNRENVMRKAARPQWVTQSFLVDVRKLSKLHRVFPKRKDIIFLWTYSSSHFFFFATYYLVIIFYTWFFWESRFVFSQPHSFRGFLACFWVTLPLGSSPLGHGWTNAHDFPWKNNSSSWGHWWLSASIVGSY